MGGGRKLTRIREGWCLVMFVEYSSSGSNSSSERNKKYKWNDPKNTYLFLVYTRTSSGMDTFSAWKCYSE